MRAWIQSKVGTRNLTWNFLILRLVMVFAKLIIISSRFIYLQATGEYEH